MAFQCKQFSIEQDKCAMKVNTDSMILGSWVEVDAQTRILDIGTGTGILALMLAQKAGPEAVIDAIELDADAAAQARENVLASPWAENINTCQGCVLSQAPARQYDLIVSNPPYFEGAKSSSNAYSGQSDVRKQARQSDSLSSDALFQWVAAYLEKHGDFYCLYPADAIQQLIPNAEAAGLYCHSLMWVQSQSNKPAYVAALRFRREPSIVKKASLIIHNESGEYSEEFRALCREYYLHF